MLDKVTLFCFAASYAAALGMELWFQYRPRPVLRLVSLIFGAAGLIAQTIYLVVQKPTIAAQYGWMLTLAWILAIFYFYGTLHHRRLAWGIFVLPLVLILVLIAAIFSPKINPNVPPQTYGWTFQNPRFLNVAHVSLLLLAAVGLSIAFLASVMYLVQSQRLKSKTMLPENKGWKLPSLERLSSMNRHAMMLAFPLLTLGMFLGLVSMFKLGPVVRDWTDPRVISAGLLWIVLVIVMYLRYARHLSERRVAILTIASFVLLIVTFIFSHVDRGGMG